jgi:2-polyprenyl-3-methyl-5-hydroxy-6-metoxy-1,4-benzoquinol methylase
VDHLDHCPICASTQLLPSFSQPTSQGLVFTVERCAKCAHEFVNPQPSPEELRPFYPEDYTSWDSDRLLEEGIEKELQAARSSGTLRHVRITPGMKVLDFGCGAGQFLELATRLKANAVGVDIGEPNTRRLKARGLDVFRGTLEEFVAQATPHSFDLITSSHVFEHLHDPVGALRQFRQLLKPDGLIWIAVPNAANWGYRTLRGKWYATQVPIHLHHFTPSSLRMMIERAGLRGAVRSESLVGPTASTLRDFLRHKLLLPFAVSKRLPWLNSGFAAWLGKRMDLRETGDGLLAEMRGRPG